MLELEAKIKEGSMVREKETREERVSQKRVKKEELGDGRTSLSGGMSHMREKTQIYVVQVHWTMTCIERSTRILLEYN